MMNRMLSVVLTTLLVVAIFLFGMFWSFKTGGIDIALNCDATKSFYAHGKLYLCVSRNELAQKYFGITPEVLNKFDHGIIY